MAGDPIPTLICLGGFLGAGKTTVLLRLAEHYRGRGRRVGVIANDQGSELVDTARFRAAGLDADEVTGGCFCCRFEEFAQRADLLIAAHQPDVLLAEPVGSCTDLVATVLRPLQRFHPGRFTIAPFTVLVDPLRALDVLDKRATVGLSEKVTYIFRMQQLEAACIAINKIDLLAAAERARVRELMTARFPGAARLEVSGRSGAGIAALLEWLESGAAVAGCSPDVDYDLYAAGEAALGWLNRQARVRFTRCVDMDAAALELAKEIGRTAAVAGVPVAHAKVLVRGASRTAIASLVRSGAAPELASAAGESGTACEILLNVRAESPPGLLDRLADAALAAWRSRYEADVEDAGEAAFSPPRPVPTHRMLEM